MRELVRTRKYRRFFAAATTARLSNEMFPVAGFLFALEETGSVTAASLCVAALTLPSLLTGPALAARPLAPLIWLDQAVAAGSLLLLLMAGGELPAWLLPLLLVPAGVTFPLSAAGFTTLIPRLVPDRLRRDANAFEAASYNTALVSGPAIAGAITIAASPALALAVQAALKLIALALAVSSEDWASPPAAGPRAGFRHLAGNRPLLAITTASTVSLSARGLLTVAFPLFAVDPLGAHRGASGLLWAALAAGALLGALGIRGRSGRRAAPTALISIAVAGLVMLTWPMASALPLALGLVGLAGAALGPALSATLTVRQEESPEKLQAQVMMTGASLKTAAFAVGTALAGPLSQSVSASEMLLLAGALHLVGAGAGGVLLARVDGRHR